MIREPESLKVYALADSLALEIHRATTNLPELERLIFGAQLRGAALAAPLHIRAGCAKPAAEGFLMELEEAASAAAQCHYLLTLARRVEMLPPADCAALEEQALHLVRSLLMLMKAERVRQRTRSTKTAQMQSV
ncbi:MAG: four helix bundle protein [Holophagaceae bacterium]|nr:four helix bundle protein [Holophagaceae bacterium]